MSISLHRVPAGEPGGVLCGTLERKKWYTWVPFLDPEVIKIKSGGHGSHDHKGHKGPVKIRPRCIGAEGPRTQLII